MIINIIAKTAAAVMAAIIVIPALIAGTMTALAAEEYKITAVSGHPPIYLWTELCRDFFIPEVDRRLTAMGSQHKIVWNQAYGGTLAPLGGCLEAVEEGIADMGLVATVFNAPHMPLHNATFMTPFGSSDVAGVVETMSELQDEIPALKAEWTSHGLVYLGGIALDSYHMFTSFPVKTVDDLKGRKLAAPGPAANWIKNTGAAAVSANLNTYYNDIKTGVYDGALTFATAAAPANLHEVAPYVCLVDFGAQFASALAINKQVFESFPPEIRQIFLETGLEYSRRLARAQAERAAADLAALEKKGAIITRLSPEERKRWADRLPNVPLTWAQTMETKGLPGRAVLKGYLDGLRRRGATLSRNWDAETLEDR